MLPIEVIQISFRGHTNIVTSLAWSPDDKLLASASRDTTVQIWEVSTGKPIVTHTGHTAAVLGVAWSHAGDFVASASADKTVLIWNPDTILNYLRHADSLSGPYHLANDVRNNDVRGVAWSPNGKYIASVGDDATLQAWDATHGDVFFAFSNIGIAVNVAWSPDGKYIAYATFSGYLNVWEVSSDAHLNTQSSSSIANDVAWSPDSISSLQ